MQIWYCEFVLKWKRSHFRSTCVTQKRLCLSSLIYSSADHPFLWVTPRKQSYPPFPACLIFSFFLTLEFPFQAFTVTWVVPDDCTADGPTPWFHQLFISLLGGNSHCTHFGTQRYLHSRAYLTQRTRASKQEYLVFPAAKGVSSCSGLWFCISHLVKMFPTVLLTFPTRVHPPLPISQRVSTASLFLSEVLIQYTPIFAVVFFWSLRLESWICLPESAGCSFSPRGSLILIF